MEIDPKLVSMFLITAGVVAIFLTFNSAQRRQARLIRAGDRRAASRVFARGMLVMIWGLAAIWTFVKVMPLSNPISFATFPWKPVAIGVAVAVFLTLQILVMNRKFNEIERESKLDNKSNST